MAQYSDSLLLQSCNLQVKRGLGEREYLLKMLARIILSSAISKKLRKFKKRLTLKEKLRNYTPKHNQSTRRKNKL